MCLGVCVKSAVNIAGKNISCTKRGRHLEIEDELAYQIPVTLFVPRYRTGLNNAGRINILRWNIIYCMHI